MRPLFPARRNLAPRAGDRLQYVFAGGFPEDSHAVRVPSEGRDIAFDPAQAFNLIEQSVVARYLIVRFSA